MTATATPPTSLSSTARPTLWHRAPGWVFYGLTGLGGAGLIWSGSYPYGGFMVAIASVWWLMGCAAVWLARLITFGVGHKQHASGRPWPFLIAPAGGIVVVAICLTSLPLQARWSVSQGAFDARADALVARVERGDASPGSNLIRDDRVALYTVDFAHVDEDGNAYFSIAGSGFIDGGGFARFSDGPPTDTSHDQYEHLEGDWYLWLEAF